MFSISNRKFAYWKPIDFMTPLLNKNKWKCVMSDHQTMYSGGITFQTFSEYFITIFCPHDTELDNLFFFFSNSYLPVEHLWILLELWDHLLWWTNGNIIGQVDFFSYKSLKLEVWCNHSNFPASSCVIILFISKFHRCVCNQLDQ